MAGKNYDVWNDGFLGSGFEEESANALRLASERAVCSVRRDPKKKGEIAVSLCLRGESSGSKEIARCALPDKAVDFFDFSVQLAKGLFGTRRRYAPFGREVLPRDLADLVENGFDYLGDDSAGKDAHDEPTPEGDDGFDALVARLADVIGAAREASDEQIHAATKAHDYAKGGKAMEKSTRLQTLQELLDDFAAKWKAEGLTLPRTEGDGEGDDEPPPPVEPPLVEPPPREPNPPPRGQTILAVTFSDGTRIADAKASETLARAIEKIGASKVAALGIQMAGDPLVTRNRDEIQKMPAMVQEIAMGWFVKTHSNTYTKRQQLERISEALGLSLKVEVLQKVKEDKTPRRRGRPPKNAAKNETPFLPTSSFSAALQEAMTRQNLSKGGLAKKLGVSRQDVRNWCKGYGEISRANYSALCRTLGVDSLG